MIGKDSAICYSIPQSRKIDAWLAERDFLKSQYELQKKALDKADQLIDSYSQLSEKHKLDAEYWRKLAKKRNRNTAIITSTVGAAAFGILMYSIFKK